MVEGDSGSPTWKFTQYVTLPAMPFSIPAFAQVDPSLLHLYILLPMLMKVSVTKF